jgi:hypothetical protein
MLIPTGFAKLPGIESCYNNQTVFGGTVGQLANGLAQLSNCKFLGEAHYNIGQQVPANRGGLINTSYTLKSSNTYNLLYQSTPLSTHLAIIAYYKAGNFGANPYLNFSLRATFSNSYTGAILDYGCRFTEGIDLSHERDNLQEAFTGCELISAPTNTTPEPPRPLYVPAAQRGNLLNVVVETALLLPFSIHIYDILIPEVTV